MKGKIDLESRYIKVPSRYFDEIKKEFEFLSETEVEFSDKAKGFGTPKSVINIQIAITQPSQGKSLKLPLKRYWERKMFRDPNEFNPKPCVEIFFVKHNEPYWSFGLHFLEDFRVH